MVKFLNGQGNETVIWQHFALVPPQLQMISTSSTRRAHMEIMGYVSGDLTIWTGNFT